VDFIIAIRREVTAVGLVALQALRGRIHELPSAWARRLDGSYFPLPLLAQTLAFIEYALAAGAGNIGDEARV
jgi:hypothetical protein